PHSIDWTRAGSRSYLRPSPATRGAFADFNWTWWRGQDTPCLADTCGGPLDICGWHLFCLPRLRLCQGPGIPGHRAGAWLERELCLSLAGTDTGTHPR